MYLNSSSQQPYEVGVITPTHFCRQGIRGTGTLSCWPKAIEQGVAALDFEPAACAHGLERFGFYLPRKFSHFNQLELTEYLNTVNPFLSILFRTPVSHLQLLKTSLLTWAFDGGLSVTEPQECSPGGSKSPLRSVVQMPGNLT